MNPNLSSILCHTPVLFVGFNMVSFVFLPQTPMMFTTVQEDVCMLMKFLSNSPITHIAANTHPVVPLPAVVTITCNHNFSVNKWNHSAGREQTKQDVANNFCVTPLCLARIVLLTD